VFEFWINHPASEKCISHGPTLGITYALSAVNASADWALGTLPFFIVWDLNMKRTTKALVAGILAFAAMYAIYFHTARYQADYSVAGAPLLSFACFISVHSKTEKTFFVGRSAVQRWDFLVLTYCSRNHRCSYLEHCRARNRYNC
jgi:hypothetical protein